APGVTQVLTTRVAVVVDRHGLEARATTEVAAAVDRDSVEPGLHAAGSVEGLAVADDADPGLLDGVAGEVVAPEDPLGQAEEGAFVAEREIAEGVAPAAEEGVHEGFVGRVH